MLRTPLLSLLVRALALASLISCAVANQGDPDARPSNDAVASVCGNGVIEPGEDCEGTALGGATCQDHGYLSGNLACDANTCRFDTSGCYSCGDGRLTGPEECEGQDLGGATCRSIGFLDGELSCDPDTCTLDASSCGTSESVQNHDNMCTRGVGCSNPEGTSGNPQLIIECMSGGRLAPPFSVTEVRYRISGSTPPPDAVNLEIYAWNGFGLPGARLASIPLGEDYLQHGPHQVQLDNPVEVSTHAFCVGFAGTRENDGFRLLYSDSSTVYDVSWLDAPVCGYNGLTLVSEVLERTGNYCVSATISKDPDSRAQ